MKTISMLMSAMLALAVSACDRAAAPEATAPAMPAEAPAAATTPATPPAETPADGATPDATSPTAATAPAAFVDKVWRVRESSAVAPGTRYSFLGDGTLVIEGEGGPPGYGRWAYENGALTMTEEDVTYPVDILAIDADGFEIRSHNPGEPVTIAFEPAADATLPAAPPK